MITNLKNPATAELIKNNQTNADFIILDVRTPAERQLGYLQTSINIDFHRPNFEQEIAKLDKQKTYLVHCRSGGRSGKTAHLMEQLNFKNIYNLADKTSELPNHGIIMNSIPNIEN